MPSGRCFPTWWPAPTAPRSSAGWAQDLHLWRLVAEGRETAEIARDLFVSQRTVKRMIALLLRRLGVAKRVQAAALAGRHGLLDPVRP